MNIDYDSEEFERHLKYVLADMSALDLVSELPDIYSVVAEAFNNDVLDSIDAEREVDEELG